MRRDVWVPPHPFPNELILSGPAETPGRFLFRVLRYPQLN